MALARVRQEANPKQYQVFDYCVLQGMRASEVASMLGLSTAQVYLAKHRVSAAVKRAAREVEAELAEEPRRGIREHAHNRLNRRFRSNPERFPRPRRTQF